MTTVDAMRASMLLGSTAVARFVVFGTTSAGSVLASAPLGWPVVVCEGCCTDTCGE